MRTLAILACLTFSPLPFSSCASRSNTSCPRTTDEKTVFSGIDSNLRQSRSVLIAFAKPVVSKITLVENDLWFYKEPNDESIKIQVGDLQFIDPGFSILSRGSHSWREFVSPLSFAGMTCTSTPNERGYSLKGNGIAVKISFVSKVTIDLGRLAKNSCVSIEEFDEVKSLRGLPLRHC
jgi:hypothetical protein